MNTTTPKKLVLNKDTAKSFKIKTNVKAGETDGANSYNKIKWISAYGCIKP